MAFNPEQTEKGMCLVSLRKGSAIPTITLIRNAFIIVDNSKTWLKFSLKSISFCPAQHIDLDPE